MNTTQFNDDEILEFDLYLQWEWPAHIEETLRRMLWISLVEACETENQAHTHTELLRWQMATYPQSPPEVLDFLSKLPNPSLSIRIAENPKTGISTLGRLARHDFVAVRAAVAESDRLTFDLMLVLVEDESADVRYALAENFSLPATYLHQLSLDDNPYVAFRASKTLARRSKKILEKLPLQLSQIRKAE